MFAELLIQGNTTAEVTVSYTTSAPMCCMHTHTLGDAGSKGAGGLLLQVKCNKPFHVYIIVHCTMISY